MDPNYAIQKEPGKNYIQKVMTALKTVLGGNDEEYMQENANMYTKNGIISNNVIIKAEQFPNEKKTLLEYNKLKKQLIKDTKNN